MSKDKFTEDTIVVTGYAKAPTGTAMQHSFSFIGVVLEIDPEDEIIVDAEVTVITDVVKRFFEKLLVGLSLADIDVAVEQIRLRYLAPSSESLIVAIRSAVQRYWDNQKER